jgi:hypothetical protein
MGRLLRPQTLAGREQENQHDAQLFVVELARGVGGDQIIQEIALPRVPTAFADQRVDEVPQNLDATDSRYVAKRLYRHSGEAGRVRLLISRASSPR